MNASLRKIFKYLLVTLASVLMLLAIAVGLIPSILKWSIQHWFEQQHLNSVVEDIEIQIFEGRLTIRNLSVSKGQQQKFKLASAIIKIDPRAILKRKIIVQKFRVRGFDLSLEQKQNKSLLLAGVALPASNASTAATTQTSELWSLTIKDIDLAGIRGCYQSVANEPNELCASLKQLKWQGEMKLDLHSDTAELTKSLQAQLTLNLRKLELKDTHNKVMLASI